MVIAVGALIAASGLLLLHHVPVDGSYLRDILPGLMLMALGIGPVFVGVTSAANAGVSADHAGTVAALLNSAQQVGGALGLAILSALATARTTHLLGAGDSAATAATAGFDRAFLVGASFTAAAALFALRTANTREATMGIDVPTAADLPSPEPA